MLVQSSMTQGITIKVKLALQHNEDISKIINTMEQYRQACNYISEYIFTHGFQLNQLKLQKEIYNDIRVRFGLKSMMAQSAIRSTIARYKTVNTQLKQNPYRFQDVNTKKWYRVSRNIEWLEKPINFARPQVDLVRNRDWSKLANGKLSINTLEGRIFATPICSASFEKYFSSDWKLGGAKLIEHGGNWYLHISATKSIDAVNTEQIAHVVGIDRGIRFHAVCHDEQGKTIFFSGSNARTKRNKFAKVRAELQSKGTKSAKRVLKRISGRENRWMTNVNHCLSKTLVRKYGKNTLFVLEDLTGVTFDKHNLKGSNESRYEKRSWAFYQLEQFLTYKANLNHSAVLKVPAQYTSQRCPKCGYIDKKNRNHKSHIFRCKCGYCSNDDRIGAMNIQQLGMRYVCGEEKPKLTA